MLGSYNLQGIATDRTSSNFKESKDKKFKKVQNIDIKIIKEWTWL